MPLQAMRVLAMTLMAVVVDRIGALTV